MALKKFCVLMTIYILLNLSELSCNVVTQEEVPPPLAEHVEYQIPIEDNQPVIHASESIPNELQEPPVVAAHQWEPNEMEQALKSLENPSYAVNQDSNEPAVVNQAPEVVNQDANVINELNDPSYAVNQDSNEPVVVNQAPEVVNQDANVINQLNDPSYAVNQDSNEPVVVNQAPEGVNQDANVINQLNDPTYVVNQDSNEAVVVNQSPDVVNQDANVINQPPNLVVQTPSATNEMPSIVNLDPSAHNPDMTNQPPRGHSPHKPSTVDFDYGTVDSLEASNEFENLPGVQHEFRIEVAAGKSECIYQRLAGNAQLHVSFQVLRGMDRNIGFLIQGPGNFVLEHIQWSGDASLQKTVPFEGLYRFCLNNELSQYSSKLVYFYMVTYIEEKWHQHSKNILDFFGEAEDIQQSLDTVDERVKKMHLEQASSRRGVISDWYLIQDNNSYVQLMSLILCIVIVASSAFQVFFVRHLFSVRNVNAKLKPRA